jgi:L-ascorbate metabolism protein UlaG (beta-lactamase superfamily)
MKIKWLGHSCFLITSDTGIRVLTDPFDEQVGYELPAVEADIVTTSHDHFDHNHISIVKGSFVHVNRPGSFEEHGIKIIGVATFHDEVKGGKRGTNTVFKFTIDDINVCHCGDLGHVLTPEQAEQVGVVDVLLLPVGGTFTVDAKEAFEVVNQLKPLVTIPMHFKTEALTFSVEGVNSFLKVAGGGEMTGSQEITLDKDNLKELSKVLVLNYK